jgi:hypothetical protein
MGGRKVSKAMADYREAPRGTMRRCDNCSMYRGGRCSLVTGTIRAEYVCDYWEADRG